MMNISLSRFLHRQPVVSHETGIHLVLACSVALLGVVNGLAVLLPTRPGRLALLTTMVNQLAPFSPSIWPVVQTGRTIALILGFFLCLLAIGLARGKQRAWQFVLLLLPLSALAHMVKGLDIEEALVIMGVWSALLAFRSYFRVASDPWRIRQGIGLLIAGYTLLFLYGMGGFSLLQGQFITTNTPHPFFHAVVRRSVNLPTPSILPLTPHAAWFVASLPWLSMAALTTGLFLFLRPVSARWWMQTQQRYVEQMRHKAVAVIRGVGQHTLSFFALAPENLLYLDPHGEGVIAYRLVGDVAVVLGDPVCMQDATERVVRDFLSMCRHQDWNVAFYQGRSDYLPLYRNLGLQAFKIGEEALLSPQTFTLSGSTMANVRTSCRRAEREGVTIQWYEGVPPLNVREQLHSLSEVWLERKEGKQATELGFSMGRLSELTETAKRADDVSQSARGDERFSIPRFVTAVAYDRHEQVCAFVTFTPIYGTVHNTQDGIQRRGWGWALDLMRRSPSAPPGVIELLLVRGLERFRECRAEVMSLGMVAMADTRQEMTPSQRHLASMISEHLHLLKLHRSLFHFKQKFQPTWESRYIVVSSTLAFPKIAWSILRAHLR
ncbi:MAG: hypothetical protein NVSMB38_14590 [Ktedonobacteraceae bacterium]